MNNLKLLPGPKLKRTVEVADSSNGVPAWETRDVTDRASEYLYRAIDIDPDVTLADVMGLLYEDPIMQAVFRRDFVAELCEEARRGPITKADEAPHERLECIELYQLWSLDTASNVFSGAGSYSVHGKGFIQAEDVLEGGYLMYKKGERINWSISMTPIGELLHLPVRVNPEVTICEDDPFAKRHGHAIQSGSHHKITLGTLIHSLLWELSWYGAPSQRDERVKEIISGKEEAQRGEVSSWPPQDFWESMGYLSRAEVYAQFFEGSAALDEHEIYRLLQEIEDREPAGSGVARVSEGTLLLRQEFSEVEGRDLRKQISEAQHVRADGSDIGPDA
jgi:hypothetical protein